MLQITYLLLFTAIGSFVWSPEISNGTSSSSTDDDYHQPIIEEEVIRSESNAPVESSNPWNRGSSGIDWNYVAPGGQSSGTRPGTVSGPTTRGEASPPAGGEGPAVTRGDLRTLSRDLVRLDRNSVGDQVSINPQGRISSTSQGDNAPSELISVSPRVFDGPTFATLYALLDNYQAAVSQRDTDTDQERQEQEDFLTAVMATPVMTRTEEFLKEKGLIRSGLRDVLREIWFTPYTRHRSTLGSSGFEHVFVGEIKDGKVSGFHNWVNFYKEETEGDLNYLGYSRTADLGDKGSLMLLRFDWTDQDKPVGSMFVGTSPELEMALYTVCFFARQGTNCPVEINGYRFNIKTHSQNYRGKAYIGTAYPNI